MRLSSSMKATVEVRGSASDARDLTAVMSGVGGSSMQAQSRAAGLEGDPTRRAIAIVLLAAAYCALVCLTWGDPDAEVRRSWRETLFNWQTLVWLLFLLALAASMIAAGYRGCPGCAHRHAPFS